MAHIVNADGSGVAATETSSRPVTDAEWTTVAPAGPGGGDPAISLKCSRVKPAPGSAYSGSRCGMLDTKVPRKVLKSSPWGSQLLLLFQLFTKPLFSRLSCEAAWPVRQRHPEQPNLAVYKMRGEGCRSGSAGHCLALNGRS